MLDPEARTTFANEAMADLLGTPQEELIGRPIDDFLSAAGAHSAHRALARRREGIAELREVELHRPDGTIVSVLIESSPLLDREGRYAGAVGMVTDITRRKQSEREVSMLAALVQSSSDAIVSCALDGTVSSWNPAAERLFGWTANEMTGRALSTVLQSGDEGTLRVLEAAAAGELVGPYEVEAVAKDRTYVPVELTAFPVDDGVGRITSVAVTMRDVRERREAERLIREVERARLDAERGGVVGTFDWFPDTNEVVWSAQAFRIHGRTPQPGYPDQTYLEVVHPDDRPALIEASLHSARTFAPLDVRYRIVLPGGDVRWIHSHAEVVEESRGGRTQMAGTLRDVTDLVRAEESAREARAELHRQALHDPLTSLPNRTLLADRLSVALAHAVRNHCAVAALVVNIERFSLVNEELGHEFGDQLLKAVGQRLTGLLRAGDTVGRLSGDEFAIVCERIEPSKAAVDALAERVLDGFGPPFAVGGNEVYLTASVGAAWVDETDTADGLLRRAATALQTAKERERGSYVVAARSGGSEYVGRGRLALRQALRDALGEGQLRLVYQPIVALDDASPRALETLLRWDHPGLGPVSPLEFIPIAEDTGLILPIGEWVLTEACATIAAGDPDLRVAVNLSARQLLQQDLEKVVTRALRESGVDADRLILEITESMLVEDSEEVEQTLQGLKRIGVRLALDDFGTGYSALGYLKRFPFDIVKVDRSFVSGLGQDPGDSAIVGAVLGMAGALGMEVIAEGIETAEQVACLRELGAEYGQGYYFARPGPPPGRN